MFLAGLTEQQKKAYLNLSYCLISADGSLSTDEVAMMGQYQQEMSIDIQLDQLSADMANASVVFQNAPNTVKKQVLFELTALAYADNEYAEAEHIFLEKLCAVWNLDAFMLDQCKSYVTELMELYGKIGQLIAE